MHIQSGARVSVRGRVGQRFQTKKRRQANEQGAKEVARHGRPEQSHFVEPPGQEDDTRQVRDPVEFAAAELFDMGGH